MCVQWQESVQIPNAEGKMYANKFRSFQPYLAVSLVLLRPETVGAKQQNIFSTSTITFMLLLFLLFHFRAMANGEYFISISIFTWHMKRKNVGLRPATFVVKWLLFKILGPNWISTLLVAPFQMIGWSDTLPFTPSPRRWHVWAIKQHEMVRNAFVIDRNSVTWSFQNGKNGKNQSEMDIY